MAAKKLKVIQVIARLNIGGPAIHTVLLAQRLDPERFETKLVTGLEGPAEGSMRDWAVSQGVMPVVIPELGREIQPLADQKVLLKLYRLFRQEKPDVVHTHTAKAGFVGRLAARLAGVPVVVHTFHGHVFHGYFSPAKTRLFIGIEQVMARLSDRIITISPLQCQEIIQFGIASPEKIVIIPLGFDLDEFFECDRLRGRLRREFGLGEAVKLVGIVARLTGIKNHRLFLEAAAQVRRRDPGVHFVVVGDGELRLELEQQAAGLGLASSVHFVGWRDDLPAVYADLDVVALTSHNEGTPTTLIEAQAAACPVVATAVGGVADIVGNGRTGYLVPPGDAALFAETVLKTLQGDTRTMGQAGRAAMRAGFTTQRLIDDMEKLYVAEYSRKKHHAV